MVLGRGSTFFRVGPLFHKKGSPRTNSLNKVVLGPILQKKVVLGATFDEKFGPEDQCSSDRPLLSSIILLFCVWFNKVEIKPFLCLQSIYNVLILQT